MHTTVDHHTDKLTRDVRNTGGQVAAVCVFGWW